MIKPSNLQQEVMKSCVQIINSWMDTNDFHSPTLSSDIKEEFNTFKVNRTDKEVLSFSLVEQCMENLLFCIKKV